jgi:hypothetical protein
MPLIQPSFRGRLRLFFAVIVIVPMIAVAVVLFQLLDASDASRLDSKLSEAQTGAAGLYVKARDEAATAAEAVENDVRLASAIRDKNPDAVRRSLDALAKQIGAERIKLQVQGIGTFETGNPTAVAPAVAALQDASGRTIGRLTLSTTGAQEYARQIKAVLKVDARIDEGGAVVATTLPGAADAELSDEKGAQVTIGDDEYRTTAFRAGRVEGRPVVVRLLALVPQRGLTRATAAVIGLTLGFLVLAFVFAILVSRTLQQEIQRLLQAAQRLGARATSASRFRPRATTSSPRSAGVQLDGRASWRRPGGSARERARLQDAIRRVGESFARGLDRVGVLEIVVQTAVDGVGAAAGRATMRPSADGRWRRSRHRRPGAFERALHAAEAAVMDAGHVAEIQIGGAARWPRRWPPPRAGTACSPSCRSPAATAASSRRARAVRLPDEPGRGLGRERRPARDRAAPGGHRRAHRALQPPPLPGGHGGRGRARPPLRARDGPDHAGHRQLQARQRHLRPLQGDMVLREVAPRPAPVRARRSTSPPATAARRWRSRCRRPTWTARTASPSASASASRRSSCPC